jgi:flagellar biosynthesis anti-sigma factor FlgM
MCRKKCRKKSKTSSCHSDELNKFKKIVSELPDTRQDKIEEIKKKIESGEYKIDGEAVAKKIFEIYQDIESMAKSDKNKK